MKKQTIIWTALPQGVATGANGATGRLNVFIAARLWDDAAGEPCTLADYPDLLHWPDQLRRMTFRVAFDSGATVTARLLDPGRMSTPHWDAVFAPDTPVFPFQFVDYRPSQSVVVPEGEIEALIQGIYGRILGATDGQSPPPRGVATSDPGLGPLGGARLGRTGPPVGGSPGGTAPGAGGATGASHAPRPGCGCSGCLFALLQPLFRILPPPAPRFGEENPLHAPPLHLAIQHASATGTARGAAPSAHDTYRQTRAATSGYRDPPPPPAPADLPKLYDFHRISSSVGDQPALQRLLGQVITLTFPLPPALPARGTVRVVPAWDPPSGMATTLYAPQTAYILGGSTFQALPDPAYGDISGGFLRVDDPARFQVVQMETVGSLNKLANAAANWAAMDDGTIPARAAEDMAALPALRNGGVSLVRRTMVEYLERRYAQSAALQAGLAQQDGSPMPPGATATATLFADDLVRGYRADVYDQQAGRWYSLHQTTTAYRFLRDGRLDTPGKGVAGEGFSQHAASSPPGEAPDGTGELRYSPSVFTWDGWSLSAARPGKVLKTGYDAREPAASPANESYTAARIETATRAAPGTLPRLRYGRTYQIRVRTVDLAGESVVAPGDVAFQQTPSAVTAPFAYRRIEPIAHPAPILCADPREGESVHRVVVRSDPAGALSGQPDLTSDRYLVAPKAAHQTVELHGGFDDAVGKPRGDAAGYRLAVREAATLARALGAGSPLTFEPIPGVKPLPSNASAGGVATGSTSGADLPEKYVGAGPFPTPYLPDPLVAGLSLTVVYAAGGAQYMAQAALADLAWPDLATVRLTVQGIDATQTPAAPALRKVTVGGGEERVLVVQLPQGQQATLFISSTLRPEAIAQLALPTWLPSGVFQPHLAHAGKLTYLTPTLELTAVHATLRPLSVPIWQRANPGRTLNEPIIAFTGQLAIHAESTGKLDFELAGTDPVDDPSGPPATSSWRIHAGEALTPAPLPAAPGVAGRLPLGLVTTPTITQHLDTRYHRATYSATASTRFREYFPTDADPRGMVRPDRNDAQADAAKAQTTVDILNTAPPPAPKLVEMLPVFNWEFSQQGASVVRARRGVLRVYLERPWFASGDGELLGVIFSDRAMADIPATLGKYVTLWGRDPILPLDATRRRRMSYYGDQAQRVVPVGKVKAAAARRPRPQDGPGHALSAADFGPATVLRVRLNELPRQSVYAAGFPVYYDADRNLRFCDVTFGDLAGATYFPFIRLALARFQPLSVDGAHLSRVVLPDFAQLLPARTATITAQGGQVGVRIDGYAPPGLTTFDVFLEQLDPAIGGDLGWRRMTGAAFAPQRDGTALWQGTCALPPTTAKVRVAIREFERIDNSESYSFTQTYMTRQPYRLIYADEYQLSEEARR